MWSGGGGGGGGSSVITWQQIATHTTGTAEASFTWSGLNGDADVEYMIVGKAVSTGTGDTLYAQPNADATTTHYHTQEVVGNNATPSAGALQADVGLEFCGATADAGSTGRCILHLYAKSGYNRPAVAHWGKGATATSRTVVVAPLDEWIDTASNITSLKVITSAGGANIGVGSYFELWALRPITIGQPTLVTKDGNGNGTDYTTASTSYQDVDATNLAYTATIPNGSKATITVNGEWYQSTALASVGLAIADGTTVLREWIPDAVGIGSKMGFPAMRAVFVGDGASHTFKVRFKTTNTLDAANIVNASTTRRPEMQVRIEAAN